MKESLRRFAIVLIWSVVIICSILVYVMYLKNWLYLVIICLGFTAHTAVNWIFQKENKSDNESNSQNISSSNNSFFTVVQNLWNGTGVGKFYDFIEEVFKTNGYFWILLTSLFFILTPRGIYFKLKLEGNEAGAYGSLIGLIICSGIVAKIILVFFNLIVFVIKEITQSIKLGSWNDWESEIQCVMDEENEIQRQSLAAKPQAVGASDSPVDPDPLNYSEKALLSPHIYKPPKTQPNLSENEKNLDKQDLQKKDDYGLGQNIIM